MLYTTLKGIDQRYIDAISTQEVFKQIALGNLQKEKDQFNTDNVKRAISLLQAAEEKEHQWKETAQALHDNIKKERSVYIDEFEKLLIQQYPKTFADSPKDAEALASLFLPSITSPINNFEEFKLHFGNHGGLNFRRKYFSEEYQALTAQPKVTLTPSQQKHQVLLEIYSKLQTHQYELNGGGVSYYDKAGQEKIYAKTAGKMIKKIGLLCAQSFDEASADEVIQEAFAEFSAKTQATNGYSFLCFFRKLGAREGSTASLYESCAKMLEPFNRLSSNRLKS